MLSAAFLCSNKRGSCLSYKAKPQLRSHFTFHSPHLWSHGKKLIETHARMKHDVEDQPGNTVYTDKSVEKSEI